MTEHKHIFKSEDGEVLEMTIKAEMSREKVLEHYGYEDTQEAHVAMGFWAKETVPERIGKLSDALKKTLDFNKKVRVIFEYDPDFPRAYLRIEGTKEINPEEAHTDSL